MLKPGIEVRVFVILFDMCYNRVIGSILNFEKFEIESN